MRQQHPHPHPHPSKIKTQQRAASIILTLFLSLPPPLSVSLSLPLSLSLSLSHVFIITSVFVLFLFLSNAHDAIYSFSQSVISENQILLGSVTLFNFHLALCCLAQCCTHSLSWFGCVRRMQGNIFASGI